MNPTVSVSVAACDDSVPTHHQAVSLSAVQAENLRDSFQAYLDNYFVSEAGQKTKHESPSVLLRWPW